MRERIYSTEALILRRSDFGEADRLVLIVTPAGKQRIVARGVRKTTSRLAGHIELFTHATVLLAIGRNLNVLTQSTVLTPFHQLRTDLERLGCAYYAAELYDTFTQEQEASGPLFRLLLATFAALDASRNPDLVLRAYELRLLHLLGYRPHLQHCAVCQARLSEETDSFSPTLGGAVCALHAAHDPAALPLSLSTFKLLRYMQRQPFAAVEALRLSDEVRAAAEQLLRAYICHILERELKSRVFLESLRTRNLNDSPLKILRNTEGVCKDGQR